MVDMTVERFNKIEECYEFMLAYAAQGLPGEENNRAGSQIREFLADAVEALTRLSNDCLAMVEQKKLEPFSAYEAFIEVLDRDARASLAAIELVLAQPSISSQIVDNLNASIHLRALLTDLFLLGDIFKSERAKERLAATN